ncbi:site-specific integrase [Massilia sp. P8910]|uniref:tyrosine-type recombinase/integrase n=1 Tax=Massilia antarctica TaxID=2765360 RepID=UPI001E52AB4B|nr:site-specific integrase [Massilia antarctica]MCE3602370.1 site-specific integrase [Massilia antarctica]
MTTPISVPPIAGSVVQLSQSDASVEHSLGPVADDWAAIEVWLGQVAANSPKGSSQTVATYRYHLAKLRWYCDTVCALPPSRWSMQEVQAFKAFLGNLPEFAITASDTVEASRAGASCPGPFRKRPSASSQGDIMRFVSAMFTVLHQTGYIKRDPTALLKNRKAKRRDKTRTVDLDIFAEALAGMDPHCGTATTARRLFRRDRFVLIALRELGLRASELVGAVMASVFRISDPASGKSFWVIKVDDESAKGGAGRTVPMTKTAMDALVAYRLEFGLRPLPLVTDLQPLLLSPRTTPMTLGERTVTAARDLRYFRQWGSVDTRHGLYRIVKGRLRDAAHALDARGEHGAAERLRKASPHWLRHTFATAALLGGHDIRQVAQALGHSNLRTTMDYTEQVALDQIRSWESTAPGTIAGA